MLKESHAETEAAVKCSTGGQADLCLGVFRQFS